MISVSSSRFSKPLVSMVLVFAATLLGCGTKDQFGTYKVDGTVTLNGKPLSDAHVWLLPREKNHQDATLIVRPQGRTNREGRFVLTTYYQDDGAPSGEYDAIVLHGENDPDAAAEDSKAVNARATVPMKYKDAKTSGLLVTIKNGPSNVIPLDLKTK